MNFRKELINLIKTTIILLFCTSLSYMLIRFNIRIENIIMIYLIGILCIVIATNKFIWSVIGSIASIITFNYCFTQPVYSLQIYDPNYIITIIIFLVVSIIVSSLANKIQQHAQIARANEKQTQALYEISSAYLNLYGVEHIIHHHIQSLYDYQNIINVVYYHNPTEKILKLYTLDSSSSSIQRDDAMAQWCFTNKEVCGFQSQHFKEHAWRYIPLIKHDEMLGVCALYRPNDLNEERTLFVDTLISQMVMALERERLYEEKENNRIEIEKEKLRNNLLRSLSHDLRTPLTGIAGSTSLIIDNYYTLEDTTKLNLLKSIGSDSVWLTQLVENLLNMTRIQDGKLLLKKEMEVVDDIICEAAQRCDSRKGNHHIEVHLPEHVMLVEMDGRLIIQVLTNMIDNAIKHTPQDASIDIYFHIEQDKGCFEVWDNGFGIQEDIKDQLFDSFVTTKLERSDSKRGVGLGLSICKAIVEAHDGHIYAYNRDDCNGAIFGFALPYKEKHHE